uniref:DNA replication licensing factor MCM2 n=1 Tax=Tanacetum cinerariifolium TaxID=118510 RepID=A0A6L2L8W9_TANCI|nr:DNA replication licensing factor MCM2 [Tanacetum cinerariifolium]
MEPVWDYCIAISKKFIMPLKRLLRYEWHDGSWSGGQGNGAWQVHLNTIIHVGGVVTRLSRAFPQLRQMRYHCNECGSVLGTFVEKSYSEVKPLRRLHACAQQLSFIVDHKKRFLIFATMIEASYTKKENLFSAYKLTQEANRLGIMTIMLEIFSSLHILYFLWLKNIQSDQGLFADGSLSPTKLLLQVPRIVFTRDPP